MNSLDSWIDLGEISDLISQLMPEKPGQPDNGLSLLGSGGPAAAGRIAPRPDEDDAPLPLMPDVPPEWEAAQPASFTPSAYPSLDDLPAPTPTPTPTPPPLPPPPPQPPAAPEAETEDESLYEQPRLAPEARQKIQSALAEIRNMAGGFLGPAAAEAALDEPPPAPEPISEKPPEPAQVIPAEPQERALFLPQGPLRTRLRAYADWVRGITQCQQLMVSDTQGYPLLPAENDEDAPLVSSSLQLMGALSHARGKMEIDGPNSGVYLPLGPDRWLGVLDCESGAQRVCVSMITRAPLSAAAADELTAGLKRALDGVAA